MSGMLERIADWAAANPKEAVAAIGTVIVVALFLAFALPPFLPLIRAVI